MAKKKRATTVGKATSGKGVAPKSGFGGGGSRSSTASQPPPAGYYDPALDAALGAAHRGLQDQQADYTRDYGSSGAGGRSYDDYQLALQGLGTSRDRELADLQTNTTRENQNFQAALTELARRYGILGTSQAQADRRAGVTSQGLLAQQQAIRSANQAHDTQPIQTAHDRTLQDILTQTGRVNEDYGTQAGQLGLNYERGVTDATTALGRAGREVDQFGIDTQASRLYQATQAGYVPPGSGSGGGTAGNAGGKGKRRRARQIGRGSAGRGAQGNMMVGTGSVF